MDASCGAPKRRHLSPSAERRRGEYWKARVGLAVSAALVVASGAFVFRLLHGG